MNRECPSNPYIQQLLAAEEEAEKIVQKARENRVRKLKEARVSAEEEIAIFKKNEEEKFQEELKEMSASTSNYTDIDAVKKSDLDTILTECKKNSSRFIEFLLERIVKVYEGS